MRESLCIVVPMVCRGMLASEIYLKYYSLE